MAAFPNSTTTFDGRRSCIIIVTTGTTTTTMWASRSTDTVTSGGNWDRHRRAEALALPADPKKLRALQLREWSWAAIARRERELLRERRPAPAAPPRPRRPRRRVTSPSNAYRVTL